MKQCSSNVALVSRTIRNHGSGAQMVEVKIQTKLTLRYDVPRPLFLAEISGTIYRFVRGSSLEKLRKRRIMRHHRVLPSMRSPNHILIICCSNRAIRPCLICASMYPAIATLLWLVVARIAVGDRNVTIDSKDARIRYHPTYLWEEVSSFLSAGEM